MEILYQFYFKGYILNKMKGKINYLVEIMPNLTAIFQIIYLYLSIYLSINIHIPNLTGNFDIIYSDLRLFAFSPNFLLILTFSSLGKFLNIQRRIQEFTKIVS